jgi:hypothetical protein
MRVDYSFVSLSSGKRERRRRRVFLGKEDFSLSLLRRVDPLLKDSFERGYRKREKREREKRRQSGRARESSERSEENKESKKKEKTRFRKRRKRRYKNNFLTSVPLPPLIELMYLSTSSAQSWRWLTPDSL